MFPFSSFPYTRPATLLPGYKFPLFLGVFRLEPNLSLLLQDPTAVVPLPSTTVLP